MHMSFHCLISRNKHPPGAYSIGNGKRNIEYSSLRHDKTEQQKAGTMCDNCIAFYGNETYDASISVWKSSKYLETLCWVKVIDSLCSVSSLGHVKL